MTRIRGQITLLEDTSESSYYLQCYKGSVRPDDIDQSVFAFDDGAEMQWDSYEATTVIEAGGTVSAVRRYGSEHSTLGELCYSLNNGALFDYIEGAGIAVTQEDDLITFYWFKDFTHDELYDKIEVPVVRNGENGADGRTTWAIYHDSIQQPELPAAGEQPSVKGWHTAMTSKTIWVSMKTSATLLEGEWGSAIRIRGEQGTSVSIKGRVATEADLPTNADDGAAYIVDTNNAGQTGHLFVYYAGTSTWTDVGPFQGERGDSAYLHIKYSNDGKTFTANNGEDLGSWLGRYADHDPVDSLVFSKYKWSRIAGTSVTKVEEQYALHTSSKSEPTTGWSTGLKTVSPDMPYLWNREVVYLDGVAQAPTAGQVVAMYAKDGVSIATIEDYYLATDAASGVTVDTAGWTLDVQFVSKTNRYLWNYEKITKTDGTVYKTTPVIIGNFAEDGAPGQDVRQIVTDRETIKPGEERDEALLTDWNNKYGFADNWQWDDGTSVLVTDESMVVRATRAQGSKVVTDGRLCYSIDGGALTDMDNGAGVELSKDNHFVTFYWYIDDELITFKTVNVVLDGLSAIVANLDNDMDSVITGPNGEIQASGIDLTTTVSMTYGLQDILDYIELPTGITGIAIALDGADKHKVLVNVASAAADKVDIPLICHSYEVDGSVHTRTLHFTVAKVKIGQPGANAVVVKLQPTVSSVKVAKDGTRSAASISCKVITVDGNTVYEIPTENWTSLMDKYEILYKLDNGSIKNYAYSSNISTADFSIAATFILNYIDGSNKTRIDVETIPVLFDGADGKNLVSIVNRYQWHDNGEIEPTGKWSNGTIPEHAWGKDYLWNYEVCYDDKNNIISSSTPRCIGFFSQGIKQIQERYQLSKTAEVGYNGAYVQNGKPLPPTLSADKKTIDWGSWLEQAPVTNQQYRYLWNVEAIQRDDDTWIVGAVHTAGVQGIDGAEPIIGDIDNEVQAVPLTYDGDNLNDATVAATFTLYRGNTPQVLSGLVATCTADVNNLLVIETDKETGFVQITIPAGKFKYIAKTDNITIDIEGTASSGGISKRSMTIHGVRAAKDGENAVLYELATSDTAITLDNEGNYSPTELSCRITKRDGNRYYNDAVIPGGHIAVSVDGSAESIYSRVLDITSLRPTRSIKFILYDADNTAIDVETIPVAKQGDKGADGLSVGRNLAQGTSDDWSDWQLIESKTNWTCRVHNVLLKGLMPGDKLTRFIELEVKDFAPLTNSIEVWQGSGDYTGWSSGTFGAVQLPRPLISNGIIQVVDTTTVTAEMLKNKYWITYLRFDNHTGSVRWRNCKVEKGDLPTTWCLAEEDKVGADGKPAANVMTIATDRETIRPGEERDSALLAEWSGAEATNWTYDDGTSVLVADESMVVRAKRLDGNIVSEFGKFKYSIDGGTLLDMTNGGSVEVTIYNKYVTFYWYDDNDELITFKTVNVVVSGTSPVVADLDNDMDSVIASSDGVVAASTKLTTNASIMYGTTDIFTSVSVPTSTAGISYTVNVSGKAITFNVTGMTVDRVSIPVTVNGTYDGQSYSRIVQFTIARVKAGVDAVLYQLKPSLASIAIDEAGTPKESYIRCKLLKCKGQTQEYLNAVPTGMSLWLSKDGGTPTQYNLNSDISLQSVNAKKSLTFTLVSGTSAPNASNTVDSETVAFVYDGTPGKNAVNLVLSTTSLLFPTVEGKIDSGAIARGITATLYVGSAPQTTNITASLASTTSLSVSVSGNTATVTPKTWTNESSKPAWTDTTLTITASATVDGKKVSIVANVAVVGSAQGQTVTGPQGTSIQDIVEWYLATTTKTAPTSTTQGTTGYGDGWVKQHIEPTAQYQYVWNREEVKYHNPATGQTTSDFTEPHLCCTFANGIVKHTSEYKATTSKTAPTSGWLALDAAMAQFNATNRYLWNKEVIEYKNSAENSTTVRLVAVWGEAGTSPVSVDLTNEFDSVACNSNGAVVGEQILSTECIIYNGSTKLTNQYSYKIGGSNIGTSIISSWTQLADVPVLFKSGTSNNELQFKLLNNAADVTKVVIEATSGSISGTRTFTISKTKPGANGTNATIYRISPDAQVVRQAKSGTKTPSTIAVKVLKTTGSTTTEVAINSVYLYYRKNNSTAKTRLTSTATSITVSTSDITTNCILELYSKAYNESGAVLLDRETIQLVQDGNDGNDSYIADLENEFDSVRFDQTGELIAGSQVVSTKLRIYKGSSTDPLQLTSINATTADSNSAWRNAIKEGVLAFAYSKSGDYYTGYVQATFNPGSYLGKMHLPVASGGLGITTEDVDIVINAEAVDGATHIVRTCRFTIKGNRLDAKYELLSDTTSIAMSNTGVYSPTYTVLRVYKTLNGVRTQLNNNDLTSAGLTIAATVDGTTAKYNTSYSTMPVQTTLYFSNFRTTADATLKPTKTLQFTLKQGTTTLDTETLAIAKSGNDGTSAPRVKFLTVNKTYGTPTKPTTSAASGWSNSPATIQVVKLDNLSAEGVVYKPFVKNARGFYVSTNETLSHSVSYGRLHIKSDIAQTVSVDFECFSEESYDFGVISERNKSLNIASIIGGTAEDLQTILDDESIPDKYGMYKLFNMILTAGTAGSFTINLQPGTQWFDIAYVKDSSVNYFDDKFKIRINERTVVWQVTEQLNSANAFSAWSEPIRLTPDDTMLSIGIGAACSETVDDYEDTNMISHMSEQYVAINDIVLTTGTRFKLTYNAAHDGTYTRTSATGQSLLPLRGTNIYLINATTMQLFETDYYDSYDAVQMETSGEHAGKLRGNVDNAEASLIATINWFIERYPATIVVMMTADAASIGPRLRTWMSEHGGLANIAANMYSGARRRHFFVTNVGKNIVVKPGQAYESISSVPTLFERKFLVQQGFGVMLSGEASTTYKLVLDETVSREASTLTSNNFKIVRNTLGVDEVLSYANATADGLAVVASTGLTANNVQFNADGQRIYKSSGNFSKGTYKVILTRYNAEVASATWTVVADGTPGIAGCIIRKSEWEAGRQYRNDSNVTNVSERYLDYVSVSNGTSAKWYIAKAAHNGKTSGTGTGQVPKPTAANDYWGTVTEVTPLKTPFAEINNALVGYLQTNQVLIQDGAGQAYGAFGGGTDWPLWFGGTDVSKAVVKFKKDGSGSLAAGNFSWDNAGNANLASGTIGNWKLSSYSITSQQRSDSTVGMTLSDSYLIFSTSGSVDSGYYRAVQLGNISSLGYDYSLRIANYVNGAKNGAIIDLKNGYSQIGLSINCEGNSSYGTFSDNTCIKVSTPANTTSNTGILFDIKTSIGTNYSDYGKYKRAFAGTGIGTLKDLMTSSKLNYLSIASSVTTATTIKLHQGNMVLIYSYKNKAMILPPSWNEVKYTLGLSDSDNCAFLVTIAMQPGTQTIQLCGRNNVTNKPNYIPRLLNNNGGEDWFDMAGGDTATLLVTRYGNGAYYDAFIIGLHR